MRYPLSLRVEEILLERGTGIWQETVRFWRKRFGVLFAAEMRMFTTAPGSMPWRNFSHALASATWVRATFIKGYSDDTRFAAIILGVALGVKNEIERIIQAERSKFEHPRRADFARAA